MCSNLCTLSESSTFYEGEVVRLTAGELKVMQLLWEHGELKPAQLQKLFPEPIKNPAMRSYLSILMEKGHVERRLVGKAYFYSAKTPRQNAFSIMLSQLVDTFCQGSLQQFLMTLVREEQISSADLEKLKQIAGDETSNAGLTDTPSREKKGAKARAWGKELRN